MKKSLILITSALYLTACSQSITSKEVADLAVKAGSCGTFETLLHDSLQSSYERSGEIPSSLDVSLELEKQIDQKLKNLSKEHRDKTIKDFKNLYSIIETELKKAGSSKELLKALTDLEYNNHKNQSLQETYNKAFSKFKTSSVQSFKSCSPPPKDETSTSAPSPAPALPFFEEMEKQSYNLAQFGALKAFSTAYQSCESIFINPLTKDSEDAVGIKRIGTHSAGGGIRIIDDITALRRTHPYIKNFRSPASSCVDSTEKPLIYDFGGKPYATSEADSSLNFFKNAGTGSKEWGTDCSGYVYTSLMSAGLKLDPDKPLRARGVTATPARHWKNLGSKMRCFAKVKAGKGSALKQGDIFASSGHIFMIIHLGQDPLGVEKALKNNSCSSISHRDFNFSLMQSSPSKGAVGLNHMQASDYLETSKSMRIGFVKYAKLHCSNLQKNKSSTPNISEASLVRHKLTSECVDSKRIALDNESCLSSCSFEGI